LFSFLNSPRRFLCNIGQVIDIGLALAKPRECKDDSGLQVTVRTCITGICMLPPSASASAPPLPHSPPRRTSSPPAIPPTFTAALSQRVQVLGQAAVSQRALGGGQGRCCCCCCCFCCCCFCCCCCCCCFCCCCCCCCCVCKHTIMTH
jgi:hypothetical protein